MNIDEALRLMPKTELHLHLEGAVDSTTFAELAAKHGLELPPHAVASDLYEYDSLADFLDVYSLVSHSIRDRDDFQRVTYECLERCVNSGARYVELFFCRFLTNIQHLKISKNHENLKNQFSQLIHFLSPKRP